MNSKSKVLIVDDLADNRFLLSQIMEMLEIPYKLANNGKEAIDSLEKEPFGIIFMDIEMPVMNGLETTLKIRNDFPYPKNKTPVIAITAHIGREFEERINKFGFNDSLTKPYSLVKIEQMIQKWL